MKSSNEATHFSLAVNAIQKAVVIISPDYKILAANSHAQYKWPNLKTGHMCYHVLCENTRPCAGCPAFEVIRRYRNDPIDEKPHINLKQNPCLYSYPITENSNIKALVILDFDLSSMEIMAGQLHRSNAFLRKLILSSVDGVIAADMNGNIIILNQAAATTGEYTVEEALSCLNMRDLYPNDGATQIMRKLRSDDFGGPGKLKSYDVEIQTKSGMLVPIRLNAAIVYEDGREMATIGFFHDLREEQYMKSRLEKTRIQLIQAEKMASLGKMAAGIAHQLNNPLGGISMYTQLMLEEHQLDPAVREDLERIHANAQRCKDTVKELLEFSRPSSFVMQPCDVNQAIRRTLFLLETQAQYKNIKIDLELDKALPSITGDIQQLNHLFLNIISNAADAMNGRGRLTITTSSCRCGESICISIADNGPGIPKDVIHQIFDPYFTTKEEGKGTGLGLSMAYGIVERHRGSISAVNLPKQGACFFVELPISPQLPEGVADAPTRYAGYPHN